MPVQGAGGDDGARSSALRLKGPAVETLKLEAEIDATDLLEVADPEAVEFGIHRELAALEALLYPSSTALNVRLRSVEALFFMMASFVALLR